MDKFFGVEEVVPVAPVEVPVVPARVTPSKIRYKELKTKEEIENFGKKQAVKLEKVVTKSELEDIEYYRSIGSGPINNYLRVGESKAKGFLDPTELAEIKKTTKNIESALNKSIVPDDVIAYRGISSKEIVDELNDNMGKVFTEKGFASTSLDRSIAEQFTGWMTGEGALVRIRVPKGLKGMYIGDREKELLLQKNKKYRIISKKTTEVKGTKISIFDLEAVL